MNIFEWYEKPTFSGRLVLSKGYKSTWLTFLSIYKAGAAFFAYDEMNARKRKSRQHYTRKHLKSGSRQEGDVADFSICKVRVKALAVVAAPKHVVCGAEI